MAARRASVSIATTVLLLAACTLPAATRPRTRRPARRPTSSVGRKPAGMPSSIVPVSASTRDLAVGEALRAGMAGVNGGAIAMDPQSGRVMAIVNPWLAVSNAYQPCSVFKIVVAVAGLSEGLITPESTFNCAGGCWFWPGHGPLNLRRALAVSCNPYFEWVGERLGYDRIQRYARLLGLGSPSGINLEGEASGRLPLSVDARAVGHLSSHAAGITTSAVQLGALISAAINGGVLFQPQVSGPTGFTPKERWRMPEGTVFGGLTEGFLGAVNEGSAARAFDPDVVVAGKTGTCSGVGWFASYAPADRPEIVVVVFVRPGSGHLASDVAGRIYQHLYKPPTGAISTGGGF
jgi:penicillin-binding protein 2